MKIKALSVADAEGLEKESIDLHYQHPRSVMEY